MPNLEISEAILLLPPYAFRATFTPEYMVKFALEQAM